MVENLDSFNYMLYKYSFNQRIGKIIRFTSFRGTTHTPLNIEFYGHIQKHIFMKKSFFDISGKKR